MSSATQRYVDMWVLLGMHPTNLEILQQLKSADDRQFGANMDVCGTISERDPKTDCWEEVCMAGLRSDIWNPDEAELKKTVKALRAQRRKHSPRKANKSAGSSNGKDSRAVDKLEAAESTKLSSGDIEKRRLVTKLFRTTGENIRWTGTIEELTTREVHNSIGSKHPLLSMVAILPGYEYLTLVQQNHRTFRFPSLYTLCFHDEANERTWYVNIKRKWFSLGADYVVESEGRQIGEIDGKLIGFGYNAYVTVTEPTLAANGHFMDLLTLFATSVGYHRAMRRSIRRRVAATRSGQT
ncbi:MAG: hypothetical protein R6U98_34565, partial [Pirellulaceae bacterium]